MSNPLPPPLTIAGKQFPIVGHVPGQQAAPAESDFLIILKVKLTKIKNFFLGKNKTKFHLKNTKFTSNYF